MNVAALPHPPGPRSPLSRVGAPGQLFAFRRDPTGFLLRMAETYGEVVRMRFAGREVFLLSRPADIEAMLVTQNRKFIKGTALQATQRVLGQGLLTSEGDLHLRQRRLIQPIFHRQRIAGYAESMVQAAASHSARWAEGQVLDIHAAMMALTLSIVAKTLFGTDVESEAEGISAAVNGLLHSMLLAAQEEEGGGQMTDEQVRDEAMTLFLAGHETTANALSWTWHLLSQHPAAEASLHAELDQVLQGRAPSVEDLPRLAYTRQVLSESMRLYPPAWVLTRLAVEPFQASGYTLPAGAPILASQWVNHHQARFFPEPFAFRPERWTSEFEASLPKFAYFPFGGGPRRCIGESFAWMEGVLLIAALALHWRIRPGPRQRVALQPVITLRPRYGLEMKLEKRGLPRGNAASRALT